MKFFVLAFCSLIVIIGCGAAPQARIVGGDDAEPGQVPYQAGLFFGGSPNCGGTIISERYVLTAMKCVCSAGKDTPWPPQIFTVVVGRTDLYSGGQSIVVEEITVNPNYSTFETGIALLKLTKPLVFNEYIQAIPMAKQNPPMGAEIEISGWGRTKEGEENMYRTLQINEAEVVENDQCSRLLGRIDNQVICLGHPRKNGICRGDFGGPAVYQGQLVGVASDVVGECGTITPDLFISVAVNYDWIVAHMTS